MDTMTAMTAAVRYRLERKLVWEAAERALSAFVAFTTALASDSEARAAADDSAARAAAKAAYSNSR